MKKTNAHKSLPKMQAALSRSVVTIYKKAASYYKAGQKFEQAGNPKKATEFYRQAEKLMRKADAAGRKLPGPVGRLPNPRGQRLEVGGQKKQNPCTNPAPDEWDEDEAFNLGSRAARELGHSRREARKQARYFKGGYFSKLRGRKVTFIMPIQAHNATEAKAQVKAMVTNEKPVNVTAVEIKRNPGLIDLAANLQAADFVQKYISGSGKRKRKNPSIKNLSKTFQGKASGHVSEYKAANSAPSDLARIGRFIFLKLEDSPRQTRVPGAMVAADVKEKLWLLSKNGPMFTRKAKPGEFLDYGFVDVLCYETTKAHIDGKLTEYVHKFGEDGGRKPRLFVDSEGMPIIRGGDYKIKSAGIVN